MNAVEQAILFTVAGTTCVGIHHACSEFNQRDVGVVIVVGGPQYRVGSHRQFVLLARALARDGIPVFRFDYRGLGDSEGESRSFEHIDEDLRSAIDSFVACSGITRIVVWGLCDAASAALMYAHSDPRIAGLILLNPWVHTETAEAKVRLKTYYIARLRSRDFWRKLLAFEFAWRSSLHSLWQYTRDARRQTSVSADSNLHYIERMRRGWTAFSGSSLLILSGDDMTAAEFRQLVADDPQWRRLVESESVQTITLAEANHTFARAEWRAIVERESLTWIQRLVSDHAPPV